MVAAALYVLSEVLRVAALALWYAPAVSGDAETSLVAYAWLLVLSILPNIVAASLAMMGFRFSRRAPLLADGH